MTKENDILMSRVKWLMTVRAVLVTSLLGLPLLLQLHFLKNAWSLVTFYFLLGATFFLTLIYVLFINRAKNYVVYTSSQLIIDLLFETALVMVTGGIESPFSFLYVITIVSASIFFHRKGGLLMAAGATLFYGMLVHLQYAGLLPLNVPAFLEGREVFYLVFLYAMTFFTVGMLSGRLSERLHEKEIGFSELRVFHEDMVQSIPSGLITTNLEGKITSFNRSASEMTGFQPQEALGAVWWELFAWDEIRDRYRDLAGNGAAVRFEGEILNKRGERCLLGVTICALRSEQGEQIGIIGTFQDLTQLRYLEEEMHKKERLATIGEMAAGMAHEIRNPLASLSGSIEVLKSELRLTDENRKLMEIAVKEAERLNSIITQFLLYAKPLPARRKPADLHALLSETVQLLRNNSEFDQRVKIALQTGPDPMMVSIDSDQMRQVFWNLSINAFQAMPNGGTLTISTRRTVFKKGKSRADSPDGRVEILFHDTGLGIRKEDLSKIFYPFFTTKSSGSGLGLSIVQRVIEEHSGEIEVKSTPEGTAFFLYLPIQSGKEHAAQHRGEAEEEERTKNKRNHVGLTSLPSGDLLGRSYLFKEG